MLLYVESLHVPTSVTGQREIFRYQLAHIGPVSLLNHCHVMSRHVMS